MKQLFTIFFSCILIFIGCKPEGNSSLDQKEKVENNNGIMDVKMQSEVIEERQVEDIVEQKIAKALSADDEAREKSPFKGVTCNEILSKMEATIKKYASNSEKLEEEVSVFMTDIIPSKDCFTSEDGFKKKFNRLKRKVMEALSPIEDAEESEY